MNTVRCVEQSYPAVLVEQPNGELSPYFIDEAELEAGERKAFELMRADGTKYRVALTIHRGWVCECKDYAFCLSRKRTRPAASPCKHLTAVIRMLAEQHAARAADAIEDRPADISKVSD